jgi:hypothetical protein
LPIGCAASFAHEPEPKALLPMHLIADLTARSYVRTAMRSVRMYVAADL